jgi:RNA polymerase sigma-70 factor (ECF subfamily)
MENLHGDTTSPTLLGRLRDQGDDPAWREFFDRYDPLLRQWCRRYQLDGESVDELCQRTWHRLWPRMRTFQYDPSRRFRGWLRRFLHSRAMDMLNERKAHSLASLDTLTHDESGSLASQLADLPVDDEGMEDEGSSERPVLLSEGVKAQEHVKSRVDPTNWQAFWMTKIEGRLPGEVAELQGKTYAAVYYGAERVARMLRREGERRLGGISGQRG